MTKTATKRALRSLPALRASLLYHRRETVRRLRQRADGASPAIAAALRSKAAKVARTALEDLRVSYETARVSEILRYRRAELSQAIPGIVWMRATDSSLTMQGCSGMVRV